MLNVIVLFCMLVFSGSLFAVETIPYKDVSDQFYKEQSQKMQYGSLEEKVIAIEKLKQVKSKRALRPLILVLRGWQTSTAPTKGASKLADDDNTPVNVDISDNNHPLIKFAAAQAIAAINHENGVKPLGEVYKALAPKIKAKDKPIYARAEDMPLVVATGEILRALGHLLEDTDEPSADEKASDTAKLCKGAFDVLGEALKHENYYIRSAAAEGLKNSRKKSAIPLIDAALKDEKDKYARVSLIAAIVTISRVESAKFKELLKALKDEDYRVRMRASIGIGEAGLASAEVALRQAIMVEDSVTVREQMKQDLSTILVNFVSPPPTTTKYIPDIEGSETAAAPAKK